MGGKKVKISKKNFALFEIYFDDESKFLWQEICRDKR